MISRQLTVNLIHYLTAIHKAHPIFFQYLFDTRCGTNDRLFFSDFGDAELNCKTLFDDLIIASKLSKPLVVEYSKIPVILNDAFIPRVRKVAEDFFRPVSSSLEWQTFWKEVISPALPDPMTRTKLFNLICGQFTKKVQSMYGDNKKYFTLLNVEQRRYLPKVLSFSGTESEFAIHLQKLRADCSDSLFVQAFNSELLFTLVSEEKSEQVFALLQSWGNLLKNLQQDNFFKQQGDFVHTKLNQHILSVVVKMQSIASEHRHHLLGLCLLINEYLDANYNNHPSVSATRAVSAVNLYTISKELLLSIKPDATTPLLDRAMKKYLSAELHVTTEEHPPRAARRSSQGAINKALQGKPAIKKTISDRKLNDALTPPARVSATISPRRSAGGEASAEPVEESATPTSFLEKTYLRTRSLLNLGKQESPRKEESPRPPSNGGSPRV